MAERDGAAVDVDLAGVDLQRAGARHGDAGERLVDLPQIDVLGLQPFAREELVRGFGRAQVEGGVGAGDDGSPDHLGERLEARLSRSRGRGQDPGGRAVRQLGRVARRDRPPAREGGREGGQALSRGVGPDPFVLAEAVQRRDLLGEAPSPRGGTVVRLGREGILVRARDAEAGVLGIGQLAHPDVLDRAVQAVVDHHVDHRLVAERPGGADVDGVRRAGHRVEAADEDDGGLALAQHAGGEPDRRKAREADVVDGDPGRLARDAAGERGTAAGVLPVGGLEDVAEHDVIRFEPGSTVEGGAHGGGAQLDAGVLGQRAAEAPDGRPRAGHEDGGCGVGHGRPGYAATWSCWSSAPGRTVSRWRRRRGGEGCRSPSSASRCGSGGATCPTGCCCGRGASGTSTPPGCTRSTRSWAGGTTSRSRSRRSSRTRTGSRSRRA